MKLPSNPSANDARLLRNICQQVNGLSEGQAYAIHNASTAAPTAGTFALGDFILNSAPALGEYQGWVYVTSFIGVGQVGAKKDVTANRPTKTTVGVVNDADWAGYLYFDTTLAAAGKPIWWTGAAWVDATGAAA